MQQHEDAKLETWGIVEVMGHTKYAGFLTASNVVGQMLRVDVPETNGRPAFTKYLAANSLFAITPCTEQTAREAAKSFQARPLAMFELPMLTTTRPTFDEEHFDADEEEY